MIESNGQKRSRNEADFMLETNEAIYIVKAVLK